MRGVSLGEAIVAIFLIVASVMVTTALFHSGLRYSRMAQTRAQAALYGRKVMQQLRAWARDPLHYDSDWATRQGLQPADPDYPGFVATVRCRQAGRELLVPSAKLEEMYPWPYRMPKATVPVEVTVTWGSPEQRLSLVSQIGEPERSLPDLPTVTINRGAGPPDPVPEDGQVIFSAQLRDAGGNPISGVRFSWSVVPISGRATLLPDGERDGSSVTLRHEYVVNPLLSPLQYENDSGEVRLEAVCRYRGRTFVNVTPYPVQLQ